VQENVGLQVLSLRQSSGKKILVGWASNHGEQRLAEPATTTSASDHLKFMKNLS
jgi:hypothetical protein